MTSCDCWYSCQHCVICYLRISLRDRLDIIQLLSAPRTLHVALSQLHTTTAMRNNSNTDKQTVLEVLARLERVNIHGRAEKRVQPRCSLAQRVIDALL